MYEVGAAVDVRALHVMPGVEGPEGVLHAHDYRIEVVVERDDLDERAMVCDIDVLQAALDAAADHVRDVDLEVIRPAGAEAVTVEVFARWAHGAIADRVRSSGADALTVRVWETPMAYGGYRAPLS
ncbi:MAG: putative 6-pyruvoyl tetrahydropterin synthase [Actinomycetia bacterium]|nr:putative 6-pyruvoyl tetrahydropterin synthase [Actinomycetes bacterium]